LDISNPRLRYHFSVKRFFSFCARAKSTKHENKRLVRERGLLEKFLHIYVYFGEEHEPVFEARGPKFIRGMRIGRCRGLPSEKMVG
jgi:hypothetical protein